MRSVSAVVASMGGGEALAECAATGTVVSLRLRADPLARPLAGELRTCPSLVLRLGGGTGTGVPLRCAVALSFRGLADAQYLSQPPAKRARPWAGDPLAGAPDWVEARCEEPLLTVPPAFFSVNAPPLGSAYAPFCAAGGAAAAPRTGGGAGALAPAFTPHLRLHRPGPTLLRKNRPGRRF